MKEKKPSSRNLEVLTFMRTYFAENDQLPPGQAICYKFGFTNNAAQDHVNALISRGLIERNANGKYRFSRVSAPSAQTV